MYSGCGIAISSHAARIDRLTTVPGIGANIVHWFLEQSGGLCR